MTNHKHDKIKLRRGTAAEWASSEPQPGGEVLKLGEPGYEKDTKKLKIGDGVTPWNSLPYIGGDIIINPEDIQDIIGDGFLVSGSGIDISYNDNLNSLTISTTGLQPSGNYSIVGHNHPSTDITDFNSAVSGLLPVKDIVAGTGIGVTSNSGIYTINSSNTIVSDTLEPDGFVNRTDSVISFNDSSREFNISPKSPATNYSIYNNGVKVVKNTTEIITLPDTTALYFIHFDKSTNNLSYKTTSFNFDTDIPVAQIYYNADDNKAVYFGEERHGIRMDASTHRYLHNVFGTQYVNGLSISNYSTSGDGSANSDATVAIGDGLIYDEDIDINITNSAMPSDPFEQVLYPVAQIPVYYKVGSIGAWTDTTANNFPLKVDITAQYNLNSAGVWSAANSNAPNNNRYVASWLCATSQEHSPIIAIMGQRLDSSLEQATSNNSWSDLNLNGLPITELRPLYRLIYDTKSSFVNGAKAFLVDVLDIRSHIDTITGLPQNDHGNLYGLADDDHYQYIHIDNSRTINAIHTFNNGLNASGLINAVSGNFTSLTVNNIGVSLVGHTHVTNDITDFTESVQDVVGASGFLVSGTGINISYNDSTNSLTIQTDPVLEIVYPVRALHFGGTLAFNSFTYNASPTYYWNGDFGDMRILNTIEYPYTSCTIDVSQSVTKYINDFPGRTLNYASLEVLLVDAADRIVGWGTTSTANVSGTTNGTGGTNMTISVLSFPTGIPNTWILGGLEVGLLSNQFNPVSAYQKIKPIFIQSSNARIRSNATTSPSTSSIILETSSATGTLDNYAVFNSNGNFGIGTNNPQYDLDVVGSGNFSNNLYVNGAQVSVSGHTHTSSNITDFNSAASGAAPVQSVAGKIGSVTLSKSDVGLSNVDNTSDANKPISTATQNALNLKSDVNSPISSLGTLSGSNAIDFGTNKLIQTLTLNGSSVAFTKGTGWPSNNTSVDVILRITVTSSTSITWSIVTDWFNQPTAGPLAIGTHLFLLRAIGSSIIEGHYIGNKTN